MNYTSIQTLAFIFDNKTDHILLQQISDDGPLKCRHSGIKGKIGATEDMNKAAIRSVQEASGLSVSDAVLRGTIKTIHTQDQSSVIYFVYESSKFSGELENKISGRLKWIDILTVFNVQLEGLVQVLMPNLLDGESFFEGSIQLNELDEVINSDIRICNTV